VPSYGAPARFAEDFGACRPAGCREIAGAARDAGPIRSRRTKGNDMSIIASKLVAKKRESSGKGFARRTRASGLIPGVVYGPHLEKPVAIAVDPEKVKEAIAGPKKLNSIIGLDLEGTEHLVLLKDYQLDPVSHELLHADFIDVRENEQVKVKLPLVLTGKCIGVIEGGILSQMRRELEVWALPGAIPNSVEIDVTSLKIGQSVHINDVKLPPGMTVKVHVNFTVAVVTAPEVEKVVEPVAAVPGAAAAPGAPAAPGAAGAPAAGAPAAGGAAAPQAGDKKGEAKPGKK
jgi:large subunit ribosomal protein L25